MPSRASNHLARLSPSSCRCVETPLSSTASQRKKKNCARQRRCDTTTTIIAEVLKLASKPIQYDKEEKTWLEFRPKLENYPTLVDERYVALLLHAESQPVVHLPTGTDIRTLSHTLHALMATLTKGRSLRLVQRVPNRDGFEVWRHTGRPRTRRKPRVGDSRCCRLCYSQE